MGSLQRFDRRLERMVQGTFAKLFKSGVQPVEIAGALAREMDARRAIGATRTLVPNDWTVALSPADHDRLAPYSVALGTELAQLAREHADEQRYSFVGPVTVKLSRDPDVDTGTFLLEASVLDGPVEQTVLRPPRAAAPPRAENVVVRPPVAAPTQVVRRSSQAWLIVDGVQDVALTGGRMVVGRGADADLRLDDSGVSRAHGEIRTRSDGGHDWVDLGSTNGSRVNGRVVGSAALQDGDRIEIGTSSLVYRQG